MPIFIHTSNMKRTGVCRRQIETLFWYQICTSHTSSLEGKVGNERQHHGVQHAAEQPRQEQDADPTEPPQASCLESLGVSLLTQASFPSPTCCPRKTSSRLVFSFIAQRDPSALSTSVPLPSLSTKASIQVHCLY